MRLESIFSFPAKIGTDRWINFPFDFDAGGSDLSTISKRFNKLPKTSSHAQTQSKKINFFKNLGSKKNDKVIIFGAGKAGSEAYNLIHQKVDVIAFCDNDPKKRV